MSSAAAPSDVGAAVSSAPTKTRPRVLYLLTAEISSVLVRGQLNRLAADGFDVHVGTHLAAPGSGADGHRWDTAAQRHHLAYAREISPVRDLQTLVATVRLIRQLRPDIVNASTPKAGLLGMLAARACRVPVRVYVLRGLRFETTSGTKRRLLIRLERLAERCATHVLVNSASARRVAADAGIGRRRQLRMIGAGSSNGIDVGHFAARAEASSDAARSALGVPNGARVIGFVGRLTNDKGITDVLDAFDTLRAVRDDLHLLVVGDPEPGDPVGIDVERRLDGRTDVTHVPWVPDTAVVYPAIDVLAFASAREGLPNVPLQAQAAGVPVVAYAATGTVDAIETDVGGVLVPVGDRVALVAALAGIIDDPERRMALGTTGSAWVRERFEQGAFWDELTDSYRTWLGR